MALEIMKPHFLQAEEWGFWFNDYFLRNRTFWQSMLDLNW